MRTNKFVAAWIFLFLPLVLGATVIRISADQDSPIVLKAVAPGNYPPLASAAMVKGSVKIEVKIDPAGDVTSAKIIEGHKLLQDISKVAALRWRFARSGESTERSAELTFTFVHWSDRKEEERGTTMFIPPYEVELVGGPVTVERQSIR